MHSSHLHSHKEVCFLVTGPQANGRATHSLGSQGEELPWGLDRLEHDVVVWQWLHTKVTELVTFALWYREEVKRWQRKSESTHT